MPNTINVNRATVNVNGGAATNPLNDGDYIETDATGAADIQSNGAPAASISGRPTNIYVYPGSSQQRVYYNNSYRYKLTTPSGYVGIRG